MKHAWSGPRDKQATEMPPWAEDNMRLLHACRQGDPTAWNAFIRRHEPLVRAFAYTLACNDDDAADITGLTFVRLYESIHSFRRDSQFTSWLFCIVRNIYIDTCVRPAHRADLSLDDGWEIEGNRFFREIADPSPFPEERLIRKERDRLVQETIRHLPAYQRRVIQMFYLEGRTYEEIAQETGLPVGTVKSRLSRARQMLRERLAFLKETPVAS